jgi:hypothetical protein
MIKELVESPEIFSAPSVNGTGSRGRIFPILRLAKALSALYPKESEEKRLLDAMLLAMPR